MAHRPPISAASAKAAVEEIVGSDLFVIVGKYVYDVETDTTNFISIPGYIVLDPSLQKKGLSQGETQELILKGNDLQESLITELQTLEAGKMVDVEDFVVRVKKRSTKQDDTHKKESYSFKLKKVS